MKKYFAFVSLLLFSATIQLFAQSAITIKGKVFFSDDELPAIGVVAVVNADDSTKISRKGYNTVTDANGLFLLTSREPKNSVTLSFVGYAPKTIEVTQSKGQSKTVDLGVITLEPAYSVIQDVVIKAEAPMAKVMGDTVQYNASAFKTNPDATAEDLLKKLPGVTTDENGKVQTQGESITKVMIDGKEAFESDPTAALRSLPVGTVEGMQIIDAQTDDAKFSGFDDGERIKVLNIVTKSGVATSTFGKAYVGGGMFADQKNAVDKTTRYAGGGNLNLWRDNQRFSIIAQVNNVNGQGFDAGDLGRGRSGGRGGPSGGTDVSGFSTGTGGGIKQSYSTNMNYNGTFGEKFKISANYAYYGVNNDANTSMYQDFLTSPRIYSSSSQTRGFLNSHSLSVRSEWNPTEFDRITFNPSVAYSDNFGGSTSQNSTIMDRQLSNTAYNTYSTKLQRMNGSADLWWQHRFGESGRTISVGGVVNGRRDFGSRTQHSLFTSLKNDLSDELLYDTTLIRQIGSVFGEGYGLVGSATFTQRVTERSRVSANYRVNYDESLSDNKGWNWDEAMQNYALLDTASTNYLNRNYIAHLVGLEYGYTIKKILSISASVNYQSAKTKSDQRSPNPQYNSQRGYPFQAVLPSLSISYTPYKGQNLRVNYNTNSSFPSVSQLQDIFNTENPLQISRGNKNLKQSYTNSLNLRYSYANTDKNLNFSVAAFGNVIDDYIATHRQFMERDTVIDGQAIVRGARFSEPVNLQGYQSARLFANFGFGLREKATGSNFMQVNTSVNYSYTRSPSIEDNVHYMSYSNNIGGSIAVTSNISENIDFTVRYNPSINLTTAGTGKFDRSFGHNLTGDINVIFLKHFFVNSKVQWRNTYGTRASDSRHFALLDAAVGAKFLKNRMGEVRLQCYDILNQNQSVYTRATDTYLQTNISNILQQYFMLSFTYKFDTRYGKTVRRSDATEETRAPYRGGGGGYGGGGGHMPL